MKLLVVLALSVLSASVIPVRVAAQYMYLDTDGDGLSTPADVVSPTGPTTLDVWLRTDAHRDGSPATCITGDGDLTLNSYEFILHASGGTVVWSGFINHQPEMIINLGHGESATDYHNGQGGGTSLPPGTYRLAGVTVAVTLGSPSISIASSTDLSGVFLTSFGSRCSGNDFDYTLKLGLDWFDTDGAPFGGAPNQAPVLTPPADMTLAEGTVAEQELHASDPEGQPVTFDLASGPIYAAVTTVDPGTGAARGLVRLSPGLRDAGVTTATVRATDALLENTETFTITVTDVNTAPLLAPVPDVTLTEGQFRTEPLRATDPESDPVTFRVRSGPAYVTVAVTGFGTGRVSIAPTYADAGEADVTIEASDGVLAAADTFHITVLEPFPVHNQILCPPVDMLVPSGAAREQELQAVSPDGRPVQFLLVSGPSYVTVTTTSSDPSNATGIVRAAPDPSEVDRADVTVAATDGIATDSKTFTIAVGDERALPDPEKPLFQGPFHVFATGRTPQFVASGDLEGDGDQDLVTANLSGSVTILRGAGDGRFYRRDDYPLGLEPYSVAIGDLNGDRRPDLAVADSALDVVSILYAIGECQFGGRLDLATPLRPAHVKLADWTGDGSLDLVVSDEGANLMSFFRGRGDGTFDPERHYPVGSDPCYADDGDFNGDGSLDVVIANEASNNVSVLLGNGDGTFQPHVTYPVGHDPRSVEAGDLNGDGHLDLAAANFFGNTVSVLLGVGDGTFLPHTEYFCGLSPWSLAIGDLNGDARPDLVTANVAENTTAVLLGAGGGSFLPPADHPAGLFTRFVTLADFNRDGVLDMAAVNEGASTAVVSLGTGDGRFAGPPSIAVGDPPTAVAAGDWNSDGIQDLAVGRSSLDTGLGGLEIHLGTGGGAFTPGQTRVDLEPNAMVTGDWDGDGVPDLAIANVDPDRLSILKGSGDGTFQAPVDHPLPSFTAGIVPAELTGDDHVDLAVLVPLTGLIYRFRNDGTGSFTSSPDTSAADGPLTFSGRGTALCGGDWNGDGRTDLALAQMSPDLVQLYLRTNNGFARAPSVPVSRRPIALASADFDGDLHMDLAVGTSRTVGAFPFNYEESELEILLGLGDGTFGLFRAYGAEPVPRTIHVLDANGDGRQDLAVASALSSTLSLHLGLGNGAFAPKQDFGSGGGTSATTVADLSGDGRPDLAVCELSMSRVSVWVNKGTHPVGSNRPPSAEAGGPYTGAVGAPVAFDGTGSSDPDGDALVMAWAFGDGSSAHGPAPTHTYQDEGVFPVTLTVSDGLESAQDRTTATVSAVLEARAFTAPEDGALRLFTGRPSHCVRLEPIGGSFEAGDVDLETVRLRSRGTGSADEIGAIPGKGAARVDRDRNGVEELPLCFRLADLRLLFASLTGTSDVPVTVEGSLLDGRRIHAAATLRVIGAPGFPAAFAAPNPMNPGAALFIATSKAGYLRVSLFDAAGRRVRVLADRPSAPAGMHEIRFDGRSDRGMPLASGVYFYRVESTEGMSRGRVSVLR